jgi:hypothetical protein
VSDPLAAIARIEAEVVHLSERWAALEPILLARSGDLARISRIEQDLDGMGTKMRSVEARAAKVEKRQDRTFWLFLGASSVLQVLWATIGDQLMQIFTGR